MARRTRTDEADRVCALAAALVLSLSLVPLSRSRVTKGERFGGHPLAGRGGRVMCTCTCMLSDARARASRRCLAHPTMLLGKRSTLSMWASALATHAYR